MSELSMSHDASFDYNKLHDLQYLPDNAPFEKLDIPFEPLQAAVDLLSGVKPRGRNNTKVMRTESPYGTLTLTEMATKEGIKHSAIFTPCAAEKGARRGLRFNDQQFSGFIGYSPYTSNQEAARFLRGFTSEVVRINTATTKGA